jgi:hypothetical protein
MTGRRRLHPPREASRRAALRVAVLLAAALAAAGAAAFDRSKYPDWGGQWRRPPGLPTQWDPTRRPGLEQQPPLTPEYQAIFEASVADQAAGGQGADLHVKCISNGMPRAMTVSFPVEFVITPSVTFVHFTPMMPRRIYTDGREFPTDEEPSYLGYSIGEWLDTDGDGRYDTLEVETRNFKGPRTYEPSGIPLHYDNRSIVKERIYLDRDDPDVMRNEITTIDHALTRPWTVLKTYRRDRHVIWLEDDCEENNRHVGIAGEYYFVGGDGYLMPTRKGQAPPDLRYFKDLKK